MNPSSALVVSFVMVAVIQVAAGADSLLRPPTRPSSSINRVTDDDFSLCRGPNAEGWKITFEDHFEGSKLNSSVWNIRNNMTHGPTEKELYVSGGVSVSNGTLILTTKKQQVYDQQGKLYNFTSGWVDTEELKYQKFGRLEVRAKLPSYLAGRKGMWPTAWPAHWLMPNPSTSTPPNVCWPVGGEIDIMEAYHPAPAPPQDNEQILMTYHWATQCGKDEFRAKDGARGRFNGSGPLWSEDYHTFGVEWNASAVHWYIDNHRAVHRVVANQTVPGLFVPQDPFYMILNTALNPWADAELDSHLPVDHIIDRVTWCQKDE